MIYLCETKELIDTVRFDDVIPINIDDTKASLNKLADSLINFFDDDSNVGEHFQLDYYEGNEVLNETNCHLIFICDR